jgi:hypothetical protein
MKIRNIYIALIIFFIIVVFIILYFLFFDNDKYFIELFADTDTNTDTSTSADTSVPDYVPTDTVVESEVLSEIESVSESQLKAGYDNVSQFNKSDDSDIKSLDIVSDENLNTKMKSNINSKVIAKIEEKSKNVLDKELQNLLKTDDGIREIEIDSNNNNDSDNNREEYNLNSIVKSEEEQTEIPDEYKCNSDTDDGIKEYSPDYIKNAPCNYSIHKKFMYGCKQLNPFGVDETNSNITNLLEDPSQYYKKLFRPVIANVDNTDYVGSNMPDYSNYSKITDIGQIKLSTKKPHPVPQNFTFKNTPAFNFN